MRATPVSETLLTHLQKKEAGLQKIARPSVGAFKAMGGGKLMVPEVGGSLGPGGHYGLIMAPAFMCIWNSHGSLMKVRRARRVGG